VKNSGTNYDTTWLATPLPIANGGTNSTATATAGGLGYGTGTAHAYTAAGTAGQIATSGAAGAPAWVTLVPIANGGTNSSATATNGGVGYGTGTAHAYTAVGTSGQILMSAGAAAPVWTNSIPHTTVRGPTSVGSGSTASTTYVNVPNTTALSFTKHRADTNIVLTFHIGGAYSSASDYHQYGIRVNSVDYMIAMNGLAAYVRHMESGTQVITGLAAGSYTAQPRVLVSGGAGGTITYDSTVYYSMSVTETFA
jgi:hypothetical protein